MDIIENYISKFIWNTMKSLSREQFQTISTISFKTLILSIYCILIAKKDSYILISYWYFTFNQFGTSLINFCLEE